MPPSSTAAGAGADNRESALPLVGRVCHQVFHSGKKKKKTARKLFIREHQLKCCFLFFAPLSSHPSTQFLSLSAAVTDFFHPRLKYEYFRAKKLRGNNEMAPQVKLYSISRVTEERLCRVASTPVGACRSYSTRT